MNVELTLFQFQSLLEVASELGAKRALIKAGKLKPYLKKSEALRMYGRNNVEHWIEEGLITPRKDGNDSAAWRIDRIELDIIAKGLEVLRFL